MRVDQTTLAAHRAALLDSAGRLFRARGIDAVGIAEISRDAGLTHGAFYGHFPSKTAIAGATCTASLQSGANTWRQIAATARQNGTNPLRALIDRYLTPAHRDAPQSGCALAAQGAEMTRDPSLAAALATGTEALLDVLQDIIARDHPNTATAEQARRAHAVLAAMTGGLILARALRTDPERSAAILSAAADMAERAASA